MCDVKKAYAAHYFGKKWKTWKSFEKQKRPFRLGKGSKWQLFKGKKAARGQKNNGLVFECFSQTKPIDKRRHAVKEQTRLDGQQALHQNPSGQVPHTTVNLLHGHWTRPIELLGRNREHAIFGGPALSRAPPRQRWSAALELHEQKTTAASLGLHLVFT